MGWAGLSQQQIAVRPVLHRPPARVQERVHFATHVGWMDRPACCGGEIQEHELAVGKSRELIDGSAMAEVWIERRHGGHRCAGRDLRQEAIQQAVVRGDRGAVEAELRADGRIAPGNLAAQAPGEQPDDKRQISQMERGAAGAAGVLPPFAESAGGSAGCRRWRRIRHRPPGALSSAAGRCIGTESRSAGWRGAAASPSSRISGPARARKPTGASSLSMYWTRSGSSATRSTRPGRVSKERATSPKPSPSAPKRAA